MLKRDWNPNAPSPYSGHSSTSTTDDAVWVHTPSHPYASAYSSLSNPFTSPQQEYDLNGDSGPVKKPRISQNDAGEGSSQGRDGESDGDEEEDDEDNEDGEDGVRKGTSSGRVRGKGGKSDGKQKVKMTRGSRWGSIPGSMVH